MLTCDYCGARLSQHNPKYCGRCGKALVDETEPVGGRREIVSEIASDSDISSTGVAIPAMRIQNGGRESEVQLAEHPMTLGRAPDNDIQILSPVVSKHHARIELSGAT